MFSAFHRTWGFQRPRTEGTFQPERIAQIANRYGIEGADVLDNINVARVFNSDQQVQAVKHAAACIVMDDAPYSLLIIDSIINCFRVDYVGRGELAIRQQTLNKHLNDIKKLAMEFNLGVVFTNQVSAKPDSTMSFGPGYSAVGGHILSHFSTTRLMLRKGRGEQRIIKVVDSPTIPESDSNFQCNGNLYFVQCPRPLYVAVHRSEARAPFIRREVHHRTTFQEHTLLLRALSRLCDCQEARGLHKGVAPVHHKIRVV